MSVRDDVRQLKEAGSYGWKSVWGPEGPLIDSPQQRLITFFPLVVIFLGSILPISGWLLATICLAIGIWRPSVDHISTKPRFLGREWALNYPARRWLLGAVACLFRAIVLFIALLFIAPAKTFWMFIVVNVCAELLISQTATAIRGLRNYRMLVRSF